MRVFIFGTGAMACLFASRLAGNVDVMMFGTWAEAIAAIRERGIRIDEAGQSRLVKVGIEVIGADAAPCDLAIILVKSWQSRQISGYLTRYLKPEGIAVSLQNGLGNLEQLGPRAAPGSTSEGATILGPGHVAAGGRGPTHMVAPQWAVSLMNDAGFDCRRYDPAEADSIIWGKLTVSCGINALTALLRIPNGELLKRPNAEDLMVRAAEECAAVARAKSIRLPFTDPGREAMEVARRTAENRSSMLQDLLRGAPTECDAINGSIAGEGRRLGIATPVNDILWQLVQAAVHQHRSLSK